MHNYNKWRYYLNILENASKVINCIEEEDPFSEKIEAYRLYNNSFIGLLKNKYPYNVVSDDTTVESISIDIDGKEYKCDFKTLKHQLKKSVYSLINVPEITKDKITKENNQEQKNIQKITEQDKEEKECIEFYIEDDFSENTEQKKISEEICVLKDNSEPPEIIDASEFEKNIEPNNFYTYDTTVISDSKIRTPEQIDMDFPGFLKKKSDMQQTDKAKQILIENNIEKNEVNSVIEHTGNVANADMNKDYYSNIINRNQLFYDYYKIDVSEISNDITKTVELWIYPMEISKEEMVSAPIITVAKIDGQYKLFASPEGEGRKSISMEFGDYDFLIRASWKGNEFISSVFPSGQILERECDVNKTLSKKRPEQLLNPTHMVMKDEDIEIHIVPGSFENAKDNGMTDILIFTNEEPRQMIVPVSSNVLELTLSGKQKNAVAYWEKENLKCELNEY